MAIKNEKMKVLKFKVASPCNESWQIMKGDGGVRFCGSCKQNVYDSSKMTLAEVESMVNSASGACMKLYQRKDGTILTKDCSVGLKKKRRKQKIVGLGLAALAGIGGAGVGMAQHVMGEVQSEELINVEVLGLVVEDPRSRAEEIEEFYELMGDIAIEPAPIEKADESK